MAFYTNFFSKHHSSHCNQWQTLSLFIYITICFGKSVQPLWFNNVNIIDFIHVETYSQIVWYSEQCPNDILYQDHCRLLM